MPVELLLLNYLVAVATGFTGGWDARSGNYGWAVFWTIVSLANVAAGFSTLVVP